ncbi:MAG: hypothetical protein ACJ74O_15815 [Frankiaceae bacterium]
MDVERIIRPSAVLTAAVAARVVQALEDRDVSRGGLWNATPTLWQRFDRAWNGVGGLRGTAVLLGSIAVMYDMPVRNQITIYKVSITEDGVTAGYTVERLCDEALAYAGYTLATCPRATLVSPPPPDPFKKRPDVTLPSTSGASRSIS